MNDERNPFLLAADNFMPAPVKRAEARKARRFEERQAANLKAPGPAEKKIREQSRLTAGYRRARRADWREALRGPRGVDLILLRRVLRGISDPEMFIKHVRFETNRWIAAEPPAIRRLAFNVVCKRIEKIRQDAGLPIFDDAIPPLVEGDPGETPCVVTLCRRLILHGL